MQVARHLSAALAVCFIAVAAAAPPAAAQQFEILHAFAAPLAVVKAPMIAASDGALYGAYSTGGKAGIGGIFAARPRVDGSMSVTTVHEFERSQGGGVVDALIEGADLWLYGVAPEHGPNGYGTIFKFHPVTAVLIVVHAFSNSDGRVPRGPLVIADDGNRYGMTTAAGPGGDGTIFKLTPEGVLTTLYEFHDAPPGALLQAPDGNLYGGNGPHLFRLTLAGTLTRLHTFTGVQPFGSAESVLGLTRGLDGHLYGVSRGLPPLGRTSFFRLTLAGEVTRLNGIDELAVDLSPVPLLRLSDGSFLGTLVRDGNDHGRLFRFTPTGVVNILHEFSDAEGRAYSGVVRHANGFYYGTTIDGSFSGLGMIYSLGAGASIVTRYPFIPFQPYAPSAPPIDGPDGAMYGTTIGGGVLGLGAVYRLTASGLTVIHHFIGLDGARPLGRLLLGADGFLYGTTFSGGLENRGTVYRVSPSGAGFQILHAFTALEGENPTAGVTPGADGNYWGTTVNGGSARSGTVFKINPAGAFTQVHAFEAGPIASTSMVHPFAGLIQAQDGNLYGTTFGAASLYSGAVFRVTPDGTLTHVVSMPPNPSPTSDKGARLSAGLVEASDGFLYGGPCCGGEGNLESHPHLFQLSLSGSLTRLTPYTIFSALTEGSDLALYGATQTGTLFRLETGGVISELKTLTVLEGVFPSGVRIAGEWILGTTYAGGPANGGVIFRFK